MTDFEYIPIDKIKIGDFRVRTNFDEEKMESLGNHVKNKGILYPIVVVPLEDGFYEIIAGERRYKASIKAGLKTIPAIVRTNIDNASRFLEMGIENILREDLSYYERGRWVAKMKELGYTLHKLEKESGVRRQKLKNWLFFYEESVNISEGGKSDFPLLLKGIPIDSVNRARHNLEPEKRIELYKYAKSLDNQPPKRQLNRAIDLMKNNPSLSVDKAIERASGTYVDLVLPDELIPYLKKDAADRDFTLQEMIIKILRDYLG